MKPKNLDDIYPLSPMQRGMLFHSLLAPSSGTYFNQTVLDLEGPFDVAQFQRSWRYVIGRHALLRTGFRWEDLTEPVQIVYRDVDLPLFCHDWTGLAPDRQRECLRGLLAEDRRRSFDLRRAPLMRLAVVDLGVDAHLVVWSRHHLLLDGWSQVLVLREVFSIYEALCREEDLTDAEERLLPVPSSYRSYIDWLGERNYGEAERFWKDFFEGASGPTPLPTVDSPREPGGACTNDRSEELRLSAEDTARLTAFVRRHGLTTGTLFQAAWGLLLGHFSRAEDVLFGVTVSGRPPELPNVESMVGLFINTLPARVRMTPRDVLLPWLCELHRNQAALRRYDYSALVDIHGWSGMARDRPLFESLVVIGNYPVNTAGLDESTLTLRNITSYVQNSFPLTLRITPGPRLLIQVLYDSRRIDETWCRSAPARISSVLKWMTAHPDARLDALFAWLDGWERDREIRRKQEARASSVRKLNARSRSPHASDTQPAP
jgi:hypothetical protein